MASKREKKISIALGFLLGMVKGNKYFKDINAPCQEQWKYLVGGGLAGGFLGYFTVLLFGSPDDTVNYRLFKKGKLVYHGITYEDRLRKRRLEHFKRGLKFDRVLKDKPKARLDALLLERKRIKKHRPVYNIQHNNGN